ncbi:MULTISPECIES: SIS domain-containing protein [Streptomyces]|uniref:Phosphoheptose isomerase n=1 Tax=Streptomyces venezuelae TaxID=54571 RepID=A0A5P2B7K4_STRVZ|nr:MULTISPECIES: SIS domain-containing protein [Streptomyces]MYZ17704.1 SIS domain-containing protein [Streptomyces sp. SID337]NDZ89637.1 SIS domain-containing protein [Streptomyces sp. SID10115]NEB44832.1 SIS domain-containing protein [Streptomyces sp. SID339]QES26246.1 phosphoheptose isomerase [Streptomyces venezuelae]
MGRSDVRDDVDALDGRGGAHRASAVCTAFQNLVADAALAVESAAFASAVRLFDSVRTSGNCLYAIGNGGSAATAAHLACDLAMTSGPQAAGLRTNALTGNTPLLTALANDVGYDRVFSEQLARLLTPGDVVVAISVSGNSPNILEGLKTARARGVPTVGLLGGSGGSAAALVDVPLLVDSEVYGVVETVHLGLVHSLALALGTGRGRSQDILEASLDGTQG